MSSYIAVPVVRGGPAKVGLAPSAKVYAGRWAILVSEVPVASPLIPECLSVARCEYASAPKRKKSTGRQTILGIVLAARGYVQCNMLAERGAKKSDGWGLGSSAAEWSM